jgi:hypothetical protein
MWKKSPKTYSDKTLIGRGIDLTDEKKKLVDIFLQDSARKGHLTCFGSTRVGKTKIIESMIEQDIRKGNSVMLIDPKSDPDLFSKVVDIAYETNRQDELCLITPIYPQCSAKVDPLSHFYMPEELVSHVVSGIKAKEEFFINVAYETTLAIVQSLLLLQKVGTGGELERLNFEAIKKRCSYSGLQSLKDQVDNVLGEEADETKNLLDQLLSSPQDYFAKISSSLRTVLTSLSTGSVGQIIGKARSNNFMHRLENNQRVILVVQTGALLTRRTASIVARVLVSMIQSFVGRRFAAGGSINPPLCMYLDEFSNIAYLDIADLFNKAGGAGVWIHAFTQSLADIVAEIGEEHSRKILDNCNSKLFMRVNDNNTADYISEYSSKIKKYQHILQLGGGIMSREVEEQAVLSEDAKNLKVRDFYFFSYDGAYRGRSSMVDPPKRKVVFPEIQPTESLEGGPVDDESAIEPNIESETKENAA